MRTYNQKLQEALIKGLKPDERATRFMSVLEEAKNVRATPYGLKEIEPISDPFMQTKSVSFPFPQLFRGKEMTLLCDVSDVYLVDESQAPWDYTLINLKKLDGTNAVLNPGDQWHFLDMYNSIFLFNGDGVIFNDKSSILNFESSEMYLSYDRKINTGTYHKGRAVIGGFDPTDFWGDSWEQIFNLWIDNFDEPFNFTFNDIGSNYVFWSSVGGGDFPLWLYKPIQGLEGNVIYNYNEEDNIDNLNQSQIIDTLKRNQFGFMPMPWQGEVIMIESLADFLMVYGSEGITQLYGVNGGDISTYGKNNISRIGVYGRGSVGKGRNTHLVLLSNMSLATVNAEGQMQVLGYQSYMRLMEGDDISISFNEEENEFLICSSNKAFVLTSEGLTEYGQRVTSQVHVAGETFGIFDADDSEDDVLVVSNIFDFGERNFKTITSVGLGVGYSGKIEVAIDYRYNKSDAFSRSDFYEVNNEGNAMIRVSGLDFRFVVKCVDYNGFELDYADIRYQISDKRYKRSVNAGQINS